MGNATIEDWVGVAGGDFDVNFDGEGGGTEPGEEKVLLDESFATNQGAFTIDNKVMPSELTYVWNHDDRNGGYMKASAHINKPTEVDYATESWLISPELDLTTATTATLTFDHAVNFAKDMQTQQTLWVKEVGTENWQQVTIATYPAGNSWDFISSGNIDLSAQKGKKVQLGFKYVSTDQGAATWEIKNVKVVADGKGGTVDPTPEPEPEPEPQPQPQPGEEKVIFTEDFGTPEKNGQHWPNVSAEDEASVYKGWSNKNLTFSDPYMSGKFSNASVRTTSTMNGHVWFAGKKESALKIEGFDTSNYTQLKLTFKTTGNAAGKANILTLKCGEQAVEIPATDFTQNNYVSIELTNLPENFTSIEFKSTAAANTIGMRVDDVTLSGVAK